MEDKEVNVKQQPKDFSLKLSKKIKALSEAVRECQHKRIRVVFLGASGSGKTMLQANLVAAVSGKAVVIPYHAATVTEHGTHFLTQGITRLGDLVRRLAPSELEGGEPEPLNEHTKVIKGEKEEKEKPGAEELLITDMRGYKYDAEVSSTIGTWAEEAHQLYLGAFPRHLLRRPEGAELVQNPIVQDFQHCIILVVAADNKQDLEFMPAVAAYLAKHGLPYLVVLTKVDKLHTSLQECRTQVAKSMGLHETYVLPMINLDKARHQTARTRKLALHILVNIVRFASQIVKQEHKPSIGTQGKVLANDLLHVGRGVYETIASPIKSMPNSPAGKKEKLKLLGVRPMELVLIALVIFLAWVVLFYRSN